MNAPKSKPYLREIEDTNPSIHLSLSGRVRCEVIDHRGTVVESTPWQPNLLLDQGMNKLAEISIADLFLVCAKGTDNTATSETIDAANSYGQASNLLTRTAGTRAFNASLDEGRRFRTVTGGFEGTILTVLTATTATVDVTQTFTDRDLVLWSVSETGLLAETDVEDAGGAGALIYKTLGSNEVTTTGDFSTNTDIVGRAIYFPTEERSFLVTALVNDTTITITVTDDDFAAADEANAIVYPPLNAANLRAQSRTDTYSTDSADNGTAWSGATIGTGAHPDHIKTLTRTFVFDPVTVSETIREVGFSHSNVAGNNLNIRVKLATPVVIDGPSGDDPGQQLRVQYQMVITFPTLSVGPVNAPISDTAELMSASKSGFYAIEGPFCSGISNNGQSVNTNPVLDPYFEAKAVISSNSDDLTPLAFPTRSGGFTADTLEQNYVAGSFSKTFVATFGVNDAIAANLRTLMLYSGNSAQPAFTFKFQNPQTKDAEHALIVRFTKTWSRTLSP